MIFSRGAANSAATNFHARYSYISKHKKKDEIFRSEFLNPFGVHKVFNIYQIFG